MHCSPAALAHTHKYNWRLEANSRYSVRPCPLGPETDGLNEPALAGAELKQNYAKHCRNKTNRAILYMSPARHCQHCLVGILPSAASSKHGLRVSQWVAGFQTVDIHHITVAVYLPVKAQLSRWNKTRCLFNIVEACPLSHQESQISMPQRCH